MAYIHVDSGATDGTENNPGAVSDNQANYALLGYSQVASALQADAGNSSVQALADSTIPAANPMAGGTFAVSDAEQKALGLTSATNSALDGYMSLTTDLAFEYDQAPSSNINALDAVGAFEHEISEVMGRIGADGSSGPRAYGSGIYTPLDLYRYLSSDGADPAAGTPERATMESSNPAYFSINGGKTDLGDYNRSNRTQDYGDWTVTQFGDVMGAAASGNTASLSGNDVVEMAAIGWNMSSSAKTLAAATTAYALA